MLCLESPLLSFYCDQGKIVNVLSRGNIIDHFATTLSSIFDKNVSIPGVVGHDAVILDMSTAPHCYKPINRKSMLWNKTDTSSFRYDVNIFSTNFVHLLFPDAYSCWTVIVSKVIHTIMNSPHQDHTFSKSQ